MSRTLHQQQPVPEIDLHPVSTRPTPSRAGPLALEYEGGDLRYIALGDREVLRRVYVAVRDRNWGTVPPHRDDERLEVRDDSFRITYHAIGQKRELFTYQGVKALDEIVHARLAFTADDRRAGIAPVPVRYDTGTYTVTRENVDLFLNRKSRL